MISSAVFINFFCSHELNLLRLQINNNNNNRLSLERVKTLNSSPKILMTLWPSKQLQNIDATTNNYKIYCIKKIKYNEQFTYTKLQSKVHWVLS